MPDYYPMENNTQNSPQPTPPRRKQMAPRDMLLIALAVLVLVRVDWRHMNSFHYLILFLLVLCFMLRWSNMRKDARRQELLKKKAEYEATQQQSAEDTPAAHLFLPKRLPKQLKKNPTYKKGYSPFFIFVRIYSRHSRLSESPIHPRCSTFHGYALHGHPPFWCPPHIHSPRCGQAAALW